VDAKAYSVSPQKEHWHTGAAVEDSTPMHGVRFEDLQIVVLSEQEARQRAAERKLNDVLCDDSFHGVKGILMTSVEEISCLIKCVLLRALEDAYRCQHYVDVIAALHANYVSEECCAPMAKPTQFKRSLLDACQKEYEALFFQGEKDQYSHRITGQGLEAYREKYQHRRRLAMMALFAKLFIQGLLALKVVDRVFHDLIEQCQISVDPFHLEYICNLLSSIGHILDRSSKGEALVNFIMLHLAEFKSGSIVLALACPNGVGFKSITLRRIAGQPSASGRGY